MLNFLNNLLTVADVIAFGFACFWIGKLHEARRARKAAAEVAESAESTLLELMRTEIIPGMAKAGAPEAVVMKMTGDADELEKHIKEHHKSKEKK